MERNLFKYIWHNSWRDQLAILAVVLISKVFYLVSLDLPKQIVNNGIQGKVFKDTGATEASFLHLTIGPIHWLGIPQIDIWDGVQLDQLNYLFALCFSYLFFVVANGWMKQRVNTDKGRLGERMLRRLRYQLFDRVLRFPFGHFRRVKQAEIATMIKDEVDPIGGFIGDAYVTPADLLGTALTALYFLFTQSIFLGGVTIAVLGVQLVVIPRLRRKILQLGRQRQLTARQLAGRIAEVVDGAQDIHVHDTSNYERADIVHRLGIIFKIRFDLYKRKFFVKYLNNMLAQTTPFLFYIIGGYLALKGTFDVGSLLAAINAYKDVPSPVKELIDWDQQRQDVQIKYDQVIEQFSPDGMLEPEHQAIDAENDIEPAPLTLSAVVLHDESGAKLIEGVSVEFPPDRHIAIVGPGSSGKEALGHMLARLVRPTGGTLRYGGRNLEDLPESVTGRRFGYVGDETYLFPRSLRDNLIYGLKHRPLAPREYEGESLREFERRLREAERSGNPALDVDAQWIDFESAGVTDEKSLEYRLITLLREVEFEDDAYQFGLRGRIDPNRDADLASYFLTARVALQDRLHQPSFASLVEIFDPTRYNKNMTVAENLLFGTAVGSAFAQERLGDNRYVNSVLKKAELRTDLMAMGARIAETMVELFADLPPGNPFFEQFSFIAADDLPLFKDLTQRLQKSGVEKASAADRRRLIALTFPYIEARHRLGLIDEAMQEKLLAARRIFAEGLPEDLAGAIEFYNPERFNAAASVQDNMLFGRLVYGQAQAAQKIGRLIAEVIEGLNLKGRVIEVGLDYNVGAGGKRLSTPQRQKVALARVLLKRPQLAIFNNALAVFDEATQRRLAANIRRVLAGTGIVLTTDNAALARQFEIVLVMKEGRIIEQGQVKDLDRAGTKFRELAGETVGAAA